MSYQLCHQFFLKSIGLLSTLFTIYLVVNLFLIFFTNPTVTTLENSSYPVSKIPFPGISVCSLNKISKKRAINLAQSLSVLTEYNSTTLLKFVRFIGQLHDFDFHPETVNNLIDFQKILNMAGFKLRTLIKELATPCEELLEMCIWQKQTINCSKIFQMKLTYDGYCCVFNYLKKASAINKTKNVEIPISTGPGINFGLKIVINNNLDDFFYSLISSRGVQVFVSTDYPDKASGNLDEVLVPASTENFIEIIPTSIKAVSDVKNYPINNRNCLFDYERQNALEGAYSYSDCNVGCQVESTLALCQCIPFKIPIVNDSTVCTLEDIPCLNRYRNKWFSLAPDTDVEKQLLRETHDSLRCSERCYPSCSGLFYKVQLNTFPILNKTLMSRNITIAYIYYGHLFFMAYKMDVLYYWFEILSNFGGLFGLLMGVSLISALQFCIFCVKKMIDCFHHAIPK